jgi:hypothetical protein
MSGTIINYSSWLQSVGSNTVAAVQTGAARTGFGDGVGRGLLQTGFALGGILGGAWMVLA